ncbi:MAG TPA: hypothetical protein VHE08_04550 [Solirubrobacterales bacterium]|nr:hypothetical protein [Solirubrobacterales bacterium]
MRARWERLGLRGRLTLSFGAIVVLAFTVVFVTVHAQMSHERAVINREESREAHEPDATAGERHEADGESPIEDAQSDVEKTFLPAGSRTPSPASSASSPTPRTSCAARSPRSATRASARPAASSTPPPSCARRWRRHRAAPCRAISPGDGSTPTPS